MLENCDRTLRRELGDEALFFEIGHFNETLGLDPDVGGGGGDGDDGDGTYTARDKDHAHQLLGEGYQGNDVIDSAKALAGIEGLRMYDTKLYNTNQRIQSIHARLLSSGNRDMDYYPIEDYATTPGVHLLIRMPCD